jgi:hypothetical protein
MMANSRKAFGGALAVAALGIVLGCAHAPPAKPGNVAAQQSNVSESAAAPKDAERPNETSQSAGPLSGWFLAGNGPSHYRISTDSETKHGGVASACLTAVEDPGDMFGTLMQSIAAGDYRDKRVRLSAFVRTHSVSGWTGVWMRVDREQGEIASFDNMRDRPIKGTTDWAKYEVVLDVPHDAKTINFGVLQTGPGKTWLDDVALDTVDHSVAVTDIGAERVNAAPTNLDFDQR